MSENSVEARLTTALADRYRVERELGAGGMATVYLAHDLRHERDVAIKVLHPDLGAALGADRFLAEIKTTAKLQHPHILPLLDSGAADGLLFYVMPYVRGDTLRTRLTNERQLPVDDAIRIAREVASALDHAHKQGVIHRDIKPENILLQDGAALVADFGIALAVQQAGGQRMTQTGLSLGTPQYMSPEQATGERTIDARSDIYALGAVTYEMLAGEPPFSGPTVQAVVARLLSDVPRPITPQRKAVPRHVEAAVLRALEKLPADRFAQASAFAVALDSTATLANAPSAYAATAHAKRRSLAVGAGVAMVAAAAGWWIGHGGVGERASGERTALDVTVGLGSIAGGRIAISPDGRMVASLGVDSAGTGFISIRDLAVDSLRTVSGSGGAQTVDFSANGSTLYFVNDKNELRAIPATGGASTVLATGAGGSSVSEGSDGRLYYTTRLNELVRIPLSGGTPEKLTTVDSARKEFGHWDPQLLPGEKAVLFYSYVFPVDSSRVELLDLETRTRHVLVTHARKPRYVDGGILTFVRDGTVMAVRFNAASRRIDGIPAAVLPGVAWGSNSATVGMAVSRAGTLVYVKQSEAYRPQLVREVMRDGRNGELLTPTGRWAEPRLSPDGRALALTSADTRWQISILDLERRVSSQFTRGEGVNFSPNWTPDGRVLIYATETPFYAVVRRSVDGGAIDTLLHGRDDNIPTSVGPNGESFSFTRYGNPSSVMLKRGSAAPTMLGDSVAARGGSVISPDGRWIAYSEQATGGRADVYVQSLSSPARRQVSVDGGDQPRWTKAGRELVFRRGEAVLAASFSPETGEPGRQVELFRRPNTGQLESGATTGYDVSPDGQRFFLIEPQQGDLRRVASLVFNWRQDLERAVRR